jgi:hypothetical protein
MAAPTPIGDQTPTGDPNKEKDRRITWRAAVLTAIVGLVAGLLGSGLGLIGTHMTLDAQHDELVTAQRQAIYSRFLSDLDKISNEVLAGRTATRGIITQALATALDANLGSMSPDYAQVQLLGSNTVTDAVVLAAIDLEQMGGQLIGAFCAQSPKPEVMYCGSYVADPDTVPYTRFIDHKSALVAAMRAELGVS